MRKSDKKIDNQIIKTLTEVCQSALEDIDGFEWLTHSVNFEKFPASLKVVCVFDSNIKLANYIKSSDNNRLTVLITASLADIGIKLHDAKQQITLDSEENCSQHHDGNWRKRLS
tara:strand:+ start:18 stop:359 length:342 start_codon:yes stop_codon:yes gene_type:complete